MDMVRGADARHVTQTADATTAAAGAVGGAAISGVVGGVEGKFAGIGMAWPGQPFDFGGGFDVGGSELRVWSSGRCCWRWAAPRSSCTN